MEYILPICFDFLIKLPIQHTEQDYLYAGTISVYIWSKKEPYMIWQIDFSVVRVHLQTTLAIYNIIDKK